MKKILVVASHPDDEILGVGGTIINHINNGDDVYVLFLAQGGDTSRLIKRSNELVERSTHKIQEESLSIKKFLGLKEVFFLDFPDNKMDTVPLIDICKEVEKYLSLIKPEIIYTHYENDLNVDHEIVFRAVTTACRPCNENCPKEIYSFEVLSGTEWQIGGEKFKPNFYVDITESITKKIIAMEMYQSEIREYPHSRSKEGINILAQYRGLECGKRYAEAFKLIRKVI
jgi:LmbE family N-acetylglucosaminyl deacetylase